MKTKVLSMILIVSLLFSLAACSGAGNTVSVSSTSTEEETSPFVDAAPVTVDGLQLGMGLAAEEPAAGQLDENPDRDIDRAVEPIKPVPAAMLDGTPLGDEFYFYRSTLDSTYQQAYDLR